MRDPKAKPAIVVWLQLLALLAVVAGVGFAALKLTSAAEGPPGGRSASFPPARTPR